jgi:hypothetical protein
LSVTRKKKITSKKRNKKREKFIIFFIFLGCDWLTHQTKITIFVRLLGWVFFFFFFFFDLAHQNC